MRDIAVNGTAPPRADNIFKKRSTRVSERSAEPARERMQNARQHTPPEIHLAKQHFHTNAVILKQHVDGRSQPLNTLTTATGIDAHDKWLPPTHRVSEVKAHDWVRYAVVPQLYRPVCGARNEHPGVERVPPDASRAENEWGV